MIAMTEKEFAAKFCKAVAAASYLNKHADHLQEPWQSGAVNKKQEQLQILLRELFHNV